MSEFFGKFHKISKEVLLIEMPKKIVGGTSNIEFTQLVEEIRNSDVKFVLIDLSKVEIINSIG